MSARRQLRRAAWWVALLVELAIDIARGRI